MSTPSPAARSTSPRHGFRRRLLRSIRLPGEASTVAVRIRSRRSNRRLCPKHGSSSSPFSERQASHLQRFCSAQDRRGESAVLTECVGQQRRDRGRAGRRSARANDPLAQAGRAGRHQQPGRPDFGRRPDRNGRTEYVRYSELRAACACSTARTITEVGTRPPDSEALSARNPQCAGERSFRAAGGDVPSADRQAEVSLNDLRYIAIAMTGILSLALVAFALILRLRHRDNPVTELERALRHGEFVPYYQPIVDITNGTPPWRRGADAVEEARRHRLAARGLHPACGIERADRRDDTEHDASRDRRYGDQPMRRVRNCGSAFNMTAAAFRQRTDRARPTHDLRTFADSTIRRSFSKSPNGSRSKT